MSSCLPTVSWELSPSNFFFFIFSWGLTGGLVSARNSRHLLRPLINEIAFCREAPEVTPCYLSNQVLVSRCPTSPGHGEASWKSCPFPAGSGARAVPQLSPGRGSLAEPSASSTSKGRTCHTPSHPAHRTSHPQ